MQANKRYYKILSCALVVALVFACFSFPAYAVDFNSARMNRFKALIASAIQAINIGLSASQATFSDLTNYISDPFDFVYTYSEQASDDYWDQQTIHLYKDYVVIDDVPYTDIWLSRDIAEKMRVDAFDFKTAYDIVSNSNGTFASGTGVVAGAPVFNVNGNLRSQTVSIPKVPGTYSFGDLRFDVIDDFYPGTPFHVDCYYNNSLITSVNDSPQSVSSPFTAYIYCDSAGSPPIPTHAHLALTSSFGTNRGDLPNSITIQPFSFDYVSSTIPADEALPQDTGLMLRVPSSAIDQWMEDNPDETNVDWNIDVDSPDIMGKLDDLFDLIVPIIPIIEADFSEQHVAPVPPVPGETISDTEYSILDQTLQDIRESIESIPSAISSAIDSLVSTIENADFDFIDTFWKNFLTPFTNLFSLIHSHLSIWHYVVEWISFISGVFTFFLGVLSGAGSGFLLPIYACAAGTVVIAVYKRFGK